MDGKKTVREVLKEADPELKVVDFKQRVIDLLKAEGYTQTKPVG
jgi:negative regulator of sigma E activity